MGTWFIRFDEPRMKIIFNSYNEKEEEEEDIEEEAPAEFAVCDVCEGKGTHVDPNIDSHGISPEEFDDDPDFRESYFSGMYDVTCYGCNGNRVVPVVYEGRCQPDLLKKVHDAQKRHEDDIRVRESEMRYGY